MVVVMLTELMMLLAQTEEEMSDAENEIRRLQEAIAIKVGFSKVAQTRLENRLTRPHEEMCQDNAQFGLQDEVKQLGATTQALHDKLRQQQSVTLQPLYHCSTSQSVCLDVDCL